MTDVTPEEFDLVGALEGTTYPTKSVQLYLNSKAVSDFNTLEEEAALLGEAETERNNEILAEQRVLREKILNSVLNIELVGVPRSVIKAITKKAEATTKDQDERNDIINREILTRNIVKITNRAGQSAPLTDEAIATLWSKLGQDPSQTLLMASSEVNFEALRYENIVTDPNFS